MISASRSAQKRKLQTSSECKKSVKKKMAWDSYTSIKDFGYEFNEEGRLVNIENDHGFNFYVSDDHSYNQENYEMLGEVITEHIYNLLQSEDVGLKKLEIPLDKDTSSSPLSFGKQNKDRAKGFIFVSKDYDEKEKLLILVHGSGAVKAGQWARRLIINDCLDHGTQIPYIKKATEEGYGVVVLNTNQNEVVVDAKGKKTYKTIKGSESPEKHFSYVWKNIIENTKALKIFAVAHSYGGYLVVDYFSHFPKVLERVVAVAFTDSVHSLRSDSRNNVRKWFLKNSVNWVTSDKDLGTPMKHQDSDNHITRVSAGTFKHEETSWKAMESIFKYFQIQEQEFSKPSGEAKKTDGNSPESEGKRTLLQLAANFNISKEFNHGMSRADDVPMESKILTSEGSSAEQCLGVRSKQKEEACGRDVSHDKQMERSKEHRESCDNSNSDITSDEKEKKNKEVNKLESEEKSKQNEINGDGTKNLESTDGNSEDNKDGCSGRTDNEMPINLDQVEQGINKKDIGHKKEDTSRSDGSESELATHDREDENNSSSILNNMPESQV